MRNKQTLILVLILTFSAFIFFWSLAFVPKILSFTNSDFDYLSVFFNYQPSFEASIYYLLGLAVILASMVIGYLSVTRIKMAREKLFGSVKVKESWLWIGYFITLLFGLAAYLQVGGLPLFEMPLRWETDPKFMFVTFWQFFFLSALLIFRFRNKKPIMPIFIVFFFSLIFIAIMGGARHYLVRATLLISISALFVSKSLFRKTFIVFITVIILTYAFVGVISKSVISNQETDNYNDTAVKLLTNDSSASFWYLDQIIDQSKKNGFMGGRIFTESLLSVIPGTESVYGNTYVYDYLFNQEKTEKRIIDGQEIEAPVSIACTYFSIPFMDFGSWSFLFFGLVGLVAGAMIYMAFFRWWFIPFVSLYSTELIYGIYGGFYGPNFIIIYIINLLILVLALIYIINYNQRTKVGLA